MGDGVGYHRDIYVGMVAEELAKQGYYDMEKEMFAFIGQLGDNEFAYFFDNEWNCAMTCLQLLEQGASVTPYRSKVILYCTEQEYAEKSTAVKEELKKTLQSQWNRGEIFAFHNSKDVLTNLCMAPGETLWSGFVYVNGTKCYSNAYLPTTLKKWFALSAECENPGDILTKKYVSSEKPVMVIKEEMKKLLLGNE